MGARKIVSWLVRTRNPGREAEHEEHLIYPAWPPREKKETFYRAKE